jgi:hypothetical protein
VLRLLKLNKQHSNNRPTNKLDKRPAKIIHQQVESLTAIVVEIITFEDRQISIKNKHIDDVQFGT